ncbi:MAG TPA: hypothetical protein VF765_26175 [Polyangiaceae bacterium]
MSKYTAPAVVGLALALAACKPSAPAPSAQASATTTAAASTPVASTAAASSAAPAPHKPSLGPGDAAPQFSLQGSDGKMHALSDDAGKDVVVVAWFPKAFTGG